MRLDGAEVSASLFNVLGVRPALGRTFNADENKPGKTTSSILCARAVAAAVRRRPGRWSARRSRSTACRTRSSA